jgi:hypothetical protein
MFYSKGELNMRKKALKSVKVTDKCHNQLKYISKGSKLTIGEFLDELVDSIFSNVACQYPTGFNINYLPSVSGSYVMVQCLGRNRILQSGKFLQPKTMSNGLQEINGDMLEDALNDKAMRLQVEKSTTFANIANQMSKRAKIVKKVKIKNEQ